MRNVNTLSFDNPRSAIVKRGKVNLSQHEKINQSISNDINNISGSGSLNNTLTL